MSTPPAPARLAVVVATAAPIAVVIRRGPSHWSQLIKWNLETDEFEPGQWLKGKVYYASLSPDGEHIAMAIIGRTRRARRWEGCEYTLVSRPPYFTALAIRLMPLVSSQINFMKDGSLNWHIGNSVEYRAPNPCPYRVSLDRLPDDRTISCNEFDQGRKSESWREFVGRDIDIRNGCVIERKEEAEYLLFNSNLFQPCEVETPDWALRW